MALKTFLGGVHPAPSKGRTGDRPIVTAPLPQKVVIPLAQGGAPCEPVVKVGDMVQAGQKIGDSQAFVSAPVHASISGKVTAIESVLCPTGRTSLAVVIEGDGSDTWIDSQGRSLDDLSPADIKSIVREAGLVGMGGAMFPTHVKISPPPGKSFDAVIINGAECEPYLTCDQRLMMEEADTIILGLKAWLKVTGAPKGYIGIEDNKKEAIAAIKAAAANEDNIEVVPLLTKYPQGSEKQLIFAILGREVPSGGLPVDAGALVQNIGTTYALAQAIITGKPLVERVVTVTGTPLKNPQNVKVRIGTLFSDLLSYCKLEGKVGKLINGGPMMGIAQTSAEVPVMKGTSGILLLSPEEARVLPERPCIRCGRCVEACPIRLIPTLLDQYCRHEMWEQAEQGHVADCIECGSCAYVCPSKRHLVASLRLGKAEVLARRRRNK
ncbi:MAG: electron transport complex subunit RsxC [Firmicutes bacterium]|jgi:electron transport complex protein RnfC|nr:electron transport complex subunit RsxC [Bacillota bacterium]